jgi:hypothetical protein
MLIEAKPELRSDPAPSRFGARAARPRSRKVGSAGKVHAQALVTGDRHVIEIMEVLADIMACVFEESQEQDASSHPSHN